MYSWPHWWSRYRRAGGYNDLYIGRYSRSPSPVLSPDSYIYSLTCAHACTFADSCTCMYIRCLVHTHIYSRTCAHAYTFADLCTLSLSPRIVTFYRIHPLGPIHTQSGRHPAGNTDRRGKKPTPRTQSVAVNVHAVHCTVLTMHCALLTVGGI
jgi:hypothetical protein